MEVVKSETEFTAVKSSKGLMVIHFLAEWASQCSQVTEVLEELKKDPACSSANFIQVEAEDVPELSMAYEIEAVPTIIFLHEGEVIDRVNGVKIAELTQKTRQHAQKVANITSSKPARKEDLNTRLKKLVNSAEVMLFIKGTSSEPRCGFSRTIVGLLKDRNVRFSTFDILNDDEVRQGLKVFSNWPTYPQVYVKGELIGGLDIINEMIASDEFDETFPQELPLEERLKALINQSDVMLFMKGDRNQPRCGFSRQVIDMLNAKGVKYGTFDILADDEVRQGLKDYSQWLTYPQLYVKGELLGGIDILNEMETAGELADALHV